MVRAIRCAHDIVCRPRSRSLPFASPLPGSVARGRGAIWPSRAVLPMTGADADGAPAGGPCATIDETPLERAILDLLADRREVYPSHLVGALRKQDATLPLHHTRHVLERLFCERRVARLWHRYMLPRDVGRVRGEWLAMIDRQSSRLISDLDDQGATSVARHVLASWDGWSLDAASHSVAG